MTNDSKQKATAALTAFFLLTFTFTWLFWIFAVLISLNIIDLALPAMVPVVIGAHGPLVASFWLGYKENGLSGAKKFLRAGFRLRMKPAWWIAILAFPALLAGVAFWINISINSFQPETPLLDQPLLIIPMLLFMFFLGGSFQEEFGWRGFALPRLLTVQTPFSASLILGIIWGFWHLPLFYIDGLSQSYMNFAFFLPLTISFSFIFTWVFIRTDFNLFSALLLHAALNTSLNVFPPIEPIAGGNQAAFTYLTFIYLAAAGILLFAEKRFWFAQHKNEALQRMANLQS